MNMSRSRPSPLLTRLDALSTRSVLSIALALGIAVSAADLATGNEISFSVFYVAPLALVAWNLGRVEAIIASLFASLTWFVVELIGDREYSQALIPVWNGVVRLVFFVIITSLLVTVRDSLRQQSDDARVDPLTGLLNRRGFDERAAIEIDRCQRSGKPLTVALFDLDHFKRLNDTEGHAAGDDVLRRIGIGLQATLRRPDVVGRLGGDEFGVVLPETGDDVAGVVLDRVHAQLNGLSKYTGVGFSVGVVTFNRPPTDVEEAMKLADAAMYQVKASERGTIGYHVISASGDEPRRPNQRSD